MISLFALFADDYVSCLWSGRLVSEREFTVLLEVTRNGGVWSGDWLFERYWYRSGTQELVDRGELAWGDEDRNCVVFPWLKV